jgi:hypothetical protein
LSDFDDVVLGESALVGGRGLHDAHSARVGLFAGLAALALFHAPPPGALLLGDQEHLPTIDLFISLGFIYLFIELLK